MSRTTKRNLIVIMVAVLLAVFISTLIGTLSEGYENIGEPGVWGKERNPDNLIFIEKSSDFGLTDSVDGQYEIADGNGYDITINKLGVISIVTTDEIGDIKKIDHYLEASALELEAGTYTFSCNINGDFKGDVYIATKGTSEYVVMEETFTAVEGTEYFLVIEIAADSDVDATFMPVLVTGKYAGDFYLD